MFKKTTLLTVALTLSLGAAVPVSAKTKGVTDKQTSGKTTPVSKTVIYSPIRPKKVEW